MKVMFAQKIMIFFTVDLLTYRSSKVLYMLAHCCCFFNFLQGHKATFILSPLVNLTSKNNVCCGKGLSIHIFCVVLLLAAQTGYIQHENFNQTFV